MSTNTPKPAVTLEASTKQTLKVRAGDPVYVGVKVTGDAEPVFQADRLSAPLMPAKADDGAFLGSYVPSDAGEHTITVSAGDAEPVKFTITATKE